MADTPVCKQCGAELKPGRRFCTQCRTPVPHDLKSSPRTLTQKIELVVGFGIHIYFVGLSIYGLDAPDLTNWDTILILWVIATLISIILIRAGLKQQTYY